MILKRVIKFILKILPQLILKKFIEFIEILKILPQLIFDKLNSKKIIVLDLEEYQFQQYMLPIYNELKNNKSLSFYISSRPVYIKQKVFKKSDIKKTHQFNSILNTRLFLIDIIITAHVYVKKNPKTKIVYIQHSQPGKYELEVKKYFKNMDIHFTLGPLSRQFTDNNIKKYDLSGVQVVDVGYPKTDDLINNKFEREDILRKLELDLNKKTIIYAPSWEEGLSLRKYGLRILDEFLKMTEFNIIIKLHPVSFTQPFHPDFKFYTGGINWLKELDKYSNLQNVVIIKNCDYEISPLLAVSDIMISDVSTVALEYILLDRPIIYFRSKEFFEKTLNSVYKEFGEHINPEENPMVNVGRHTGIVIDSLNDLKDTIYRCINNPSEFSKQRKELLKSLYYNPGNASRVAASEILKICDIKE